MKKKRCFLLFLFVFAYISGQQVTTPASQNKANEIEQKIPLTELEDTVSLDRTVHFQEDFQSKYTSEDYIYEEVPLKEEEEKPKTTEYEPYEPISFDFLINWIDFLSTQDIAALITWLSVLVLMAIIGRFVYLTFFINGSNKNTNVHRNLKEVENLSEKEIIETSNLEEIGQLILNAENTHNYRLALRLQFLKIFKKMIDKSFIDYKKDKTNDDYYHEIKSNDLKVSFKRITHWYDYVWYGEYYIDQSLYKRALLEFKPLLKRVF